MPFDTHSLLPLFFLAPVAFVAGMCLTTLARLPFRLGLGRVWTPLVIFRTLSPICTLVRTRILFCFTLLFVSLYCIYLDLGSLESLLYICSFGIYCKLLWCNHLWSNPPALRVCFACTWCWVGVFESFLCGVWRESLKLHRHDLRDVTSGIRALVFDTPLVRSACRLTLPTDESSVKTIFIKNVLDRSE